MKRLMAMAALALALAVALLAADTGAGSGAAALRLAQSATATGGAATGTTSGTDVATAVGGSPAVGTGTVAATTGATGAATAAAGGTPVATVDYRAGDTLMGTTLADHYTCRSCHSIDGSAGIGPTFDGLYGSNVTLADGSTVVADHGYIITSIVSPNAQIVQGYPAGLMPNFSPHMSSLQLLQLATFIESLGTPPPTGQATASTPMATPGATGTAAMAATPTAMGSPTMAVTPSPQATIVLVTKTPAVTTTGLAVPTDTAPAVEASNQAIVAGTIAVSRVVSPQGGWIVIQADDNGTPGAVLGHAYVYQGLNIAVAVNVASKGLTTTLHAVLYADAGGPRVYEVPGADTEVMANGQPVQATFQVTGIPPAATTGAATAAATTAATTAPAATAQATAAATTAPAATAQATAAATTAPAAATATTGMTAVATAAGTATAGNAQAGLQSAQQVGCSACHSADGSTGIGPTWKGLYDSTVTLNDGTTVTADANYLTQAIVSPNAQIVQGFSQGIMPQTYGQQLSQAQVANLVAYIESLK